MSQAMITTPSGAEIATKLERVLIKGDLRPLTDEERVQYYRAVCDSVGLNPLTQPFEYLDLNGKLTLYARKGCTDQLRGIHRVSIERIEVATLEGVFEVLAYARNGEGRTDVDLGAANIAGLRGEALVNAKLKAVTKAKRRVTLSICGLGMLDESEVADIPAEAKQAKAVAQFIAPAPPVKALAPAPANSSPVAVEEAPRSPRRAKPYSRNERGDNVAAIGEIIREIKKRGVALEAIQARMVELTGVATRASLNGGQAITVIEAFEAWINQLDEVAAAEGAATFEGEEATHDTAPY